jgi:hypothetical protein
MSAPSASLVASYCAVIVVRGRTRTEMAGYVVTADQRQAELRVDLKAGVDHRVPLGVERVQR